MGTATFGGKRAPAAASSCGDGTLADTDGAAAGTPDGVVARVDPASANSGASTRGRNRSVDEDDVGGATSGAAGGRR